MRIVSAVTMPPRQSIMLRYDRLIKIIFLLILSAAFCSIRAEEHEFVSFNYLGISINAPSNWLVSLPEVQVKEQPVLTYQALNLRSFSKLSAYKKPRFLMMFSHKPGAKNVILALLEPEEETQETLVKVTKEGLVKKAEIMASNIRKRGKGRVKLHGDVRVQLVPIGSGDDLAVAYFYSYSVIDGENLIKEFYDQLYVIPLKEYKLNLVFSYEAAEAEMLQKIFEKMLKSLRY